MTTVSYPAVGNAGLTAAQWSTLYGSVDGIHDDYTSDGNAFNYLKVAPNTFRILAPTVTGTNVTPPSIKVNGYALQVTANEDFTVADPATATNYRYYAIYDPALNVADGSGNANPLGPVRLQQTVGAPDLSGGKYAALLFSFTRSPGQALADVAVTDYRRWVGPHVNVDLIPSGELTVPRGPTTGFGPFPRGTVLTQRAGGSYILEPNGSAQLVWVPLTYTAGTSALTLSSGMTAQDTTPRYTQPGRSGVVRMTGSVRRSSGAALVSSTATSDVQLGSVPAEYAPANIKRFPVYGAAGASAEVKVTPDGNVWVYAHGAVDWVDLSAVSYQIGT